MSAQTIVDSHVHFWEPARFRYSWLENLPVLNRAFLPSDFSEAAAALNVSKLIFVEGGCETAESLAEVDWAVSLAKQEPRLKGVIAHVSLERGQAVREDLAALARRPLVKGVRRSLQSEPDADFCLRPEFVAGVTSLAEFGFTFDLCIRHEQLEPVTELVRRVPQVTFILDHFGKPNVRNGNADAWRKHLRALAALPNTVCKISGLTTEADWHHWRAAELKGYFQTARDLFGFDRVLFGGDWPVATLATDYRRWIETVRDLISPVEPSDCTKLFQANAERVYRV